MLLDAEISGTPKYDVFISHATEDRDFVTPLALALREAGLKVVRRIRAHFRPEPRRVHRLRTLAVSAWSGNPLPDTPQETLSPARDESIRSEAGIRGWSYPSHMAQDNEGRHH